MTDIDALEANADEIVRQIARMETELEAKRTELELTRNAIAAARLQAWYRANPGIELRVGDKLKVTDTVAIIQSVKIIPPGMCIAEVEVDGRLAVLGSIDARRMREAWLQWLQEAWLQWLQEAGNDGN